MPLFRHAVKGDGMNEQLGTDEIREEGGKSYIARVKLSVVREEAVSKIPVISGPEDVASLDFVKTELISSDRENFVCLHLNIKHAVISYEIVSIGNLHSAIVHPREVYKGAMLANSAAIIIAHNHPSGDPEPSPEDITITKRLSDAGNILGIQILDHLVFGDRGFVSLKERGLL